MDCTKFVGFHASQACSASALCNASRIHLRKAIALQHINGMRRWLSKAFFVCCLRHSHKFLPDVDSLLLTISTRDGLVAVPTHESRECYQARVILVIKGCSKFPGEESAWVLRSAIYTISVSIIEVEAAGKTLI